MRFCILSEAPKIVVLWRFENMHRSICNLAEVIQIAVSFSFFHRCLSRDFAGLIVLMRRFNSLSCRSNSPRDVAASVVALIAPKTSSSECFENSSSKLTTVAKSTPAAADAPAPYKFA